MFNLHHIKFGVFRSLVDVVLPHVPKVPVYEGVNKSVVVIMFCKQVVTQSLIWLHNQLYFQAADSVDLWLTEDPPDYQPVILESNQNETFTVKNVDLKNTREKKRKTKDGEVTRLIAACSFVLMEDFLKSVSTITLQ